MNNVVQSITLDLRHGRYGRVLNSQSLSAGDVVEVSLRTGSLPYHIDPGCTVLVNVNRPNGTTELADCIVEDNNIYIPVSATMLAAPGTAVCQIAIVGEENGEQTTLYSSTFELLVWPNTNTPDVSDDTMTALTNAIGAANTAAGAAEAATTAAGAANAAADRALAAEERALAAESAADTAAGAADTAAGAANTAAQRAEDAAEAIGDAAAMADDVEELTDWKYLVEDDICCLVDVFAYASLIYHDSADYQYLKPKNWLVRNWTYDEAIYSTAIDVDPEKFEMHWDYGESQTLATFDLHFVGAKFLTWDVLYPNGLPHRESQLPWVEDGFPADEDYDLWDSTFGTRKMRLDRYDSSIVDPRRAFYAPGRTQRSQDDAEFVVGTITVNNIDEYPLYSQGVASEIYCVSESAEDDAVRQALVAVRNATIDIHFVLKFG